MGPPRYPPQRRVAEVGPAGLLFLSPKGCWARRSNYRRNTFDPAATAAGWPRSPAGRRLWTFHSWRHGFATWALGQPGARIEDASRFIPARPPPTAVAGGTIRASVPPDLPPSTEFPPGFPQVIRPVVTHLDTTKGGRRIAKVQVT